MPTYNVTVTRSLSVNVQVEATDGEKAIDIVNADSFPLPPRDEWDGNKDWTYWVEDSTGKMVAER
jgi:hypothetical protein